MKFVIYLMWHDCTFIQQVDPEQKGKKKQFQQLKSFQRPPIPCHELGFLVYISALLASFLIIFFFFVVQKFPHKFLTPIFLLLI